MRLGQLVGAAVGAALIVWIFASGGKEALLAPNSRQHDDKPPHEPPCLNCTTSALPPNAMASPTLLADDDSTAVSTAFLAHGVATMQQLDFASATRHGNMVAVRPRNFAMPLLLRSLLLTFPNSGTTATLKLGSCLAGHSMCTEYCQEPTPYANCLWTHPSDTTNQCTECKKPERLVQCGRGALLLRSREQMKAGHYLIKTHGVEYTSDATRGTRADALLKYIERRFGVCGDVSVHSVVRVSRNVFDSLGARFHYEKQHQRVRGRSFEQFARNDICVLLRWAHRARHMSDWCPTVTLTYEQLITRIGSYAGVLSVLLSTNSTWETARMCSGLVRTRKLTWAGVHMVPEYIARGWYSARLVEYIAGAVRRYLNESVMFRSQLLVECNTWKAES
tara:strand:- start:255 stop:1430 length:1176 start_codon:yes stop_codon:yes gene_type:complete